MRRPPIRLHMYKPVIASDAMHMGPPSPVPMAMAREDDVVRDEGPLAWSEAMSSAGDGVGDGDGA